MNSAVKGFSRTVPVKAMQRVGAVRPAALSIALLEFTHILKAYVMELDLQ